MKKGISRIVFLGKPGSGKGTQALALSRARGIPHLSSGDILRAEIREGTEFGREVEEYVLRGEIGPGELIAKVILNYMERKGIGGRYILDGFPRTLLQAEELDKLFPPDIALLLSIPDEAVIDRLSKRYTCTGCGAIHRSDGNGRDGIRCPDCGGTLARRADDHPEAIEKRLEIFSAEVLPVVRYYEDAGRLARIDGTGTAAEIERGILALFA